MDDIHEGVWKLLEAPTTRYFVQAAASFGRLTKLGPAGLNEHRFKAGAYSGNPAEYHSANTAALGSVAQKFATEMDVPKPSADWILGPTNVKRASERLHHLLDSWDDLPPQLPQHNIKPYWMITGHRSM